MNSYKSQNGVLIRDEPARPKPFVQQYALLSDAGGPRRKRSTATLTVMMVLIGLVAGWIGGTSLTGAFHRSSSAMEPVDEAATAPLHPQPDARPPAANVIVPGRKPARSREAQSESQADVQLQPPRATPVDEDKEQEDRAVEVLTREQSTKEIGQNAMDKILKENAKIKRGKHLEANKRANKNEEE